MFKFHVIGNPINHSSSPMLFKYIFKQLDIDGSYKKKCIKLDSNLKSEIDFFQKKSATGINITMPFKSKLTSYADILDNDSIQTGNVNCFHFKNKKIYGYNNDVYGFSKMLNHNTINLAGSNNIIIGSGSSASSIILSLLKQNVNNIFILSRNRKSTNQIMNNFKNNKIKSLPNDKKIENCNLINCTPITLLKNQNFDIINKIPKIEFKNIIDINYKIENNILDFSCENKINGRAMFIFQALKSLDIWFESNISNKLDYKQLDKLIC